MLATAHTIAFVPSTDLTRSRRFYEGVLGLPVEHADSFAVVVRSGDTAIRITNVGPDLRAQPFTILGWDVADVHAQIARLVDRGVRLLRIETLAQDSDGLWTSPDGGRVAWFKDPDDNVLSVTQR